jgi:hypothetical protein
MLTKKAKLTNAYRFFSDLSKALNLLYVQRFNSCSIMSFLILYYEFSNTFFDFYYEFSNTFLLIMKYNIVIHYYCIKFAIMTFLILN